MTSEERAYAAEYESHMSTWGPNCGAPKAVYEGHLRVLLEAYRKALMSRVTPTTPAER
jgi:hypothetical protein